MMTTNVRNMRSIVTASSAVLVALLAVVVMLSAVSGVSADKSTTTTYETTKYVDEYNSGYYGDEYKSGYYPKYKWWAPWTWKYSSNKYNDNKYDSGYDSGYSKYGSGYSKYDSGYSKYDSGYGYSKYDSKYGVGPYYGKQYEQDEHYPCDTFYPKPKWYSPFTWKYRKYAKFDYYSGPCEVKKEEHCLPFWGKDLPHDASEATWYTVTYASGGGGCHGGAKNKYFYAKSEAHGLTFTLTNYYYNNEKWVCAIDDISRKSAICTMAGHFGGSYSTPEKCILTFKTHQKGGKCIPHHMALDCGKPPEPFRGAPITLDNIAMDPALSDNTGSVTVVSFPCVTESSQEVDFDFASGELLNLEEVRFANWVTGPGVPFGRFKFEDDLGVSSLRSIYAPRLTGTQSLEVAISSNPVLAKVDLCALKEAGIVQIFGNPELVDVKLPELTTVAAFLVVAANQLLEQLSLPQLSTTNFLEIFENENLVGISIPVLETSSNGFQVYANSNLQTLCAPNLTDGGSGGDFDGVCIGDEDGGSGFAGQPSLDADLSSLVTGTFTSGYPFCYGGGTQPPLNATTVCGVVPDGLFTTAGCSVTSKACKNTKNTKNTKKEKKNKP
ncbi:Kin17_mid domain-containing protein [Pseudoscourfieldia marina]